ncbi:histidine--tRNA ligase [Desulfolucanica intricata]|uniref:histidine--tRNA ligase n=1 Tax=Desulfolucanica intricata TaxID=1285191 RepID=UPI00082FBFAD|nr:histidine--tRNA ligase [Desulfolucanica intricata]
MLTSRPRGTNDILPGEVEKWRYIEKIIGQICYEYGFEEIRTPIFEHTELFQRGVGETTDIVEKEMYTFIDRGERSITLRPEGTASAVRAYLEDKLFAGPQPVKLYYTGPMFRYDRPQAGRFRQFHQFGVEVLGSNDPALDAEVMAMAMDFYKRLGLRDLELHINSVGCPECRPTLRNKLQEHLRPYYGEFCPNCQGRFERNPLRILDCKNPRCQELGAGAPTTLGCLCPDCGEHFSMVKKHLEILGIPFVVDPSLVRGLDYYTHTAFEIMTRDIGAQNSIGGGGRYNGLVEMCGGKPTPGIGYAIGLERVILIAENQGIKFPTSEQLQIFVAAAGTGAQELAFKILFKFRQAGFAADKDYLGRSLKAQMKYAGKTAARFTVIVGEAELEQGMLVVKNMSTGQQENVYINQVVEYIQNLF